MNCDFYYQKYLTQTKYFASERLALSTFVAQLSPEEAEETQRSIPEFCASAKVSQEDLIPLLARKRELMQSNKTVPSVCMGLVCYWKGAALALSRLRSATGATGNTEPRLDQSQIGTMDCPGLCHAAPVIRVADNQYWQLRFDEEPGIESEPASGG